MIEGDIFPLSDLVGFQNLSDKITIIILRIQVYCLPDPGRCERRSNTTVGDVRVIVCLLNRLFERY
jgi:hypothetical protein